VNEKLKALRKRVAQLTAEARAELADDVAKLAKLRDRLQKKVEVLRTEGEQAGEKALLRAEKAKEQAERTWQEISRFFERLTRKGPID
jgi:hypothetical protein